MTMIGGGVYLHPNRLIFLTALKSKIIKPKNFNSRLNQSLFVSSDGLSDVRATSPHKKRESVLSEIPKSKSRVIRPSKQPCGLVKSAAGLTYINISTLLILDELFRKEKFNSNRIGIFGKF